MHIPTVGPAMPRRGGPASRAFGRAGLRVMRWRIVGELPNVSKAVVIVAPHTTNWDFAVGLFVKFALGVDAAWLGKHTLFRAPLGALMRYWGGIPVDRSASHDVVSRTVEEFASREELILALAPEGTRRQVTRWRSGFYHIAHRAGAPIIPVAFDWGTRTVTFHPPVCPSGNYESDMTRIRAIYERVRGR